MSQNTNTPPSLPVPAEDTGNESGSRLRRTVLIGIVALFGGLILLFLLALVFSLVGGENFAGVVRTIRDLVIIFLALEGALILLALAILVLQIARLVNLLQAEVKPLLENTQATLNTMRGTVEFISENVSQPIARTSGFVAGVTSLLSAGLGLRRALKRAQADQKVAQHEQA
jgi:hypothetical protein